MMTMLVWLFQPVYANNFSTTIKGTTAIEPNEQFTITIGVSNAPSIFGLSATFDYDKDKLEIVKTEQLNGFTTTIGPKIIIDKATSNSGTFDFVRLTFKAKSSFVPNQTTTISLRDVIAPDGSKDIPGTDATLRITMSATKSSNNFLSHLSLNQGAIAFNKNTTSYTVIVDHEIENVSIVATTEDSKASVAGTGLKRLQIYSNHFPIVVTAENGSRRTYHVQVVRRDQDGHAGALSQNNRLSNLTIEGCFFEFDLETTDYVCDVSNLLETIDVNAVTADQNAQVMINQTQLQVGSNTIIITVIAPSGDERIYQIVIDRSHLAPIIKLEQLRQALSTLTSAEIIVELEQQTSIGRDVLDAIKAAGKILIIQVKDDQNRVMYQWKIDGSQIDNHQNIQTEVLFNSDDQLLLDALTRHTKGKLLVFQPNESLPAKTMVGVNVFNEYDDQQALNLYFFDPVNQTLTLEHKGLVVEQGFVWIPLSHTSQYFLTPATLKESSSSNPWMLTSGILLVLLLAVLGVISLKFKAIKTLYVN